MSDKKVIVWNNQQIYAHGEIIKKIKFVVKNMRGVFPLYGKERQILKEYATQHGISKYVMFSLRNIVKIQKEINASKFIKANTPDIKNNFVKNINQFIIHNKKLEYFLISCKIPLVHLFRILESMNEYTNLSQENLDYIANIKQTIKTQEQNTFRRSLEFEHLLESYLKDNGLNFKTEDDIRNSGDYILTPDILFDEPIVIKIDDITYTIKWMDAKNYILINTPFIIKSLTKQAEKYYHTFGLGAFVFHYGFDDSIKIPYCIILDGSTLEKS